MRPGRACYPAPVLLAALVLPSLLLGAPPQDLAAASRAAPSKEEVTSTVKDHGIEGIRGAKAVFIVEGDRDAVLATLWDVEAFPDIFPDIKAMKVLQKEPARVDVHFAVDAVVTDAEYTLRRHLQQDSGVIRWREVGEGDVKHIRGSWTVEPTSDPRYSRVIYASYVDVGYFVPTGAVRDVAIRKIDELAERVRGAVKKRAAKPSVR